MSNLKDTILPNHKCKDDKGFDLTIKDRFDSLPAHLITTDPLKCDLKILKLLAICYDVDINGLSEEAARRLVKTAFIMKRYRGTVYAVREAIQAVFPTSDIKEFEDKPYIFKVILNFDGDKVFNPTDFLYVLKAAESSKNLRSHLGGVDINIDNLRAKAVVYDGFRSEISLNSNLELKGDQSTTFFDGLGFSFSHFSSSSDYSYTADDSYMMTSGAGFNFSHFSSSSDYSYTADDSYMMTSGAGFNFSHFSSSSDYSYTADDSHMMSSGASFNFDLSSDSFDYYRNADDDYITSSGASFNFNIIDDVVDDVDDVDDSGATS